MNEFNRYFIHSTRNRWVVFRQVDTAIRHLWKCSCYFVENALSDMFDKIGWNLHFLCCNQMDINIIYRISKVVGSHRFFYICVKMNINGIFLPTFLFVRVASVEGMKMHTGDGECILHGVFLFIKFPLILLVFFLYEKKIYLLLYHYLWLVVPW